MVGRGVANVPTCVANGANHLATTHNTFALHTKQETTENHPKSLRDDLPVCLSVFDGVTLPYYMYSIPHQPCDIGGLDYTSNLNG